MKLTNKQSRAKKRYLKIKNNWFVKPCWHTYIKSRMPMKVYFKGCDYPFYLTTRQFSRHFDVLKCQIPSVLLKILTLLGGIYNCTQFRFITKPNLHEKFLVYHRCCHTYTWVSIVALSTSFHYSPCHYCDSLNKKFQKNRYYINILSQKSYFKEYKFLDLIYTKDFPIHVIHKPCGHLFKTSAFNLMNHRICRYCNRSKPVFSFHYKQYLIHLCNKYGYKLLKYAGSCKRLSRFYCIKHRYLFYEKSESFIRKLLNSQQPCKYCYQEELNRTFNYKLNSCLFNYGFHLAGNYKGSRVNTYFWTPSKYRVLKEPRVIYENLYRGHKRFRIPLQIRHINRNDSSSIRYYYHAYYCKCRVLKDRFRKADPHYHYKLLKLPAFHYHYDLNNQYSIFKHLFMDCNNIFKMRMGDFLKGHRCPFNHMSHGEYFVFSYLVNVCQLKIHKDFYYGYTNLPNTLLHLDFYIPKERIGIEFDGCQHFRQYKHFGNYKIIHKRDVRKDVYCLNHHIKLIRIEWHKYRDHDKKYYLPHMRKYVKVILDKKLKNFI